MFVGYDGLFVIGMDYVVEVVMGFYMKFGDGVVDIFLLFGFIKW